MEALTFRLALLFAMAGVAAPASPCSVAGPLPAADSLVRSAEVIVRARAQGLSAARAVPGDKPGSRTQIRFAILDVLKGSLPATTIDVTGWVENRDDPNDRSVPYDSVRPGGRSGNCFALSYNLRAEYLLLLRREGHPSYSRANELTPYWAPLSPTNEQLVGGRRDPWFVWVSQELQKR